jgi:hypothetical protein
MLKRLSALLCVVIAICTSGFAQKKYETGVLLDIESSKDSSFYEGTSTNTYFENYSIRVGDYVFKSWCRDKLFRGCNIGFTIGATVQVRFDNGEMFLLRADGKEQKTHIEKRILAASANSGASEDWRPSIDEDNKNATWDATAAFLTTIIKKEGSIRRDRSTSAGGPGSFDWSFGPEVPTNCVFQEHELIYRTNEKTLRALTWTFDFSKTDAKSVLVRRNKFNEWMVIIRGSSEEAIGSTKGVLRKGVILNDVQYELSANLKSESCGSTEQDCTPTKDTGKADVELFSDVDTAKRVARAYMHASILCGGEKAVSPF